MIRRQSPRVLAGFAIMIAIIALGVVVFFLSDLRMLLHKRYTLYAVFPSAPRLRTGSAVWIGGHRVGEVSAISFRPIQDDTMPSIAVRLNIPREHQMLVRRGSAVRLTSARLIGEPVVDIVPGPPAEPVLQEGDTIFARPQTGRQELQEGLQRFQRSLNGLSASTRRLGPALDARAAQFAVLAARIENVQREVGNLKVRTAGGSLDRFMNDKALQNALAGLGQTAQQIGPALQTSTTRFTDPALPQAFGRLQDNAKRASAELYRLRASLANGSLPRFSQDSALKRALHLAQIELDSLIAQTRGNPLRFWLGDKGRGEPLERRQ